MAPKTKAKAAIPDSEITLRAATPRDVIALYVLLKGYFEELRLAYPAAEEAPTIAWGLNVILRQGVIVAEEGGQIIGSVGMEVDSFPWAPLSKHLNALWFYVRPDRRVTDASDKLLRAAQAAAITNNMMLRMDNVWGMRPEAQDRYRRIKGFTYVGGNHVFFPPKSEN
jgi:hypothetical protein